MKGKDETSDPELVSSSVPITNGDKHLLMAVLAESNENRICNNCCILAVIENAHETLIGSSHCLSSFHLSDSSSTFSTSVWETCSNN